MSRTVLLTNIDPALIHNLKGHKKPITTLSFHPDGKQFVTGSSDHSVMMWNLDPKNTRCYSLNGHTDTVNCVSYCPSGQIFASCSQDCTVRLWVPSVRGDSSSFKAHTSAVRSVAFNPSNDRLVTGSNDKSIKVWDFMKKKFVLSFLGHNNWIKSVKYSSDGKILASCSDDRTIKIWDLTSGQCIHTFSFIRGSGNSVAIHPNGDNVAVALSTGAIRIYDIKGRKLKQHYILHDNATDIAWHPCANFLLTCGADGTMKMTDVLEGRPLYSFDAHEGTVNAVAFSNKGTYFLSGGMDKFVKVWKTNFISTPHNYGRNL